MRVFPSDLRGTMTAASVTVALLSATSCSMITFAIGPHARRSRTAFASRSRRRAQSTTQQEREADGAGDGLSRGRRVGSCGERYRT